MPTELRSLPTFWTDLPFCDSYDPSPPPPTGGPIAGPGGTPIPTPTPVYASPPASSSECVEPLVNHWQRDTYYPYYYEVKFKQWTEWGKDGCVSDKPIPSDWTDYFEVRLSRYYTFTLTVPITLYFNYSVWPVTNVYILYGTGKDGRVLWEAGDCPWNADYDCSNAHFVTLQPGDYTFEVGALAREDLSYDSYDSEFRVFLYDPETERPYGQPSNSPVISGPGQVTFAENGTGTVATFTGTNPDGSDAWLSLDYYGGDDTSSFSLVSDDDVNYTLEFDSAEFDSAPDFENPADSDGDNVYEVTVVAFGGGESATLDVTVTVADVAEAPAITGGGATHSYAENGTSAVATYTATSPQNQAISWSLGGTDANAFYMSDGELSFLLSPDYEYPSDSDGDNIYKVTVEASAGGESATLDVTVTVTDEAPAITGGGATHSYVENGASAVATYTATSPRNQAISWSLEGTDAGYLWIDTSTGELSFVFPPDYENPADWDGDNVYQITVEASADGESATLDVTVTVTDEGPTITGGGATHSYAENGASAVATYTATGVRDQEISWSLEGTDAAAFSIGAGDGELSFTRSPDYENPVDSDSDNIYKVTVEASDGGESATLDVTVTVTDVAEAPAITGGGATHSYAENGGAAVATYTATSPRNQTISWSLEGTDAAAFSIGTSDGELSFARSPDYESPDDSDTDNVYKVTVKASAGGESATLDVTVTVTDEAPTITGGGATHSYAENGASAVATYTATGPRNQEISWSLDGTDAAAFYIIDGVLRFASLPDYENPVDSGSDNIYKVTVKAWAGGESATLDVTVTVTDDSSD